MIEASHWEQAAFLKLARLGAIVFLPTEKGKYLMQVADADDESDEGKLRPPGGGKDTKDKNLTETVIREIHEEFAIPKSTVRKKVKFLGYEYRDEFWGNAVFEMRDHGLRPGVYQASNDPEEKVRLVESTLDSKKYVGPDPEKLLSEEAKEVAEEQEKAARYITYDELKEYGKDADKFLIKVHLFNPGTEKTHTLTTSLRKDETPEQAGVRTAKDIEEADIDETYVEQMPRTKDNIRQVRVLLPGAAKSASADDVVSKFKPTLTPDEMEEMGEVTARLYHKLKPRLASMAVWPTSWTTPDDSKGWVEWYQQFHQGRRSPDDARQIKRWLSFQARHGSQFKSRPTPRRAWAMVNWGIDPVALLPKSQRDDFRSEMEDFKERIDARAKKAALDESRMTKRDINDVEQIPYLPGMHNTLPDYPNELVNVAEDKEASEFLEEMARRFPPVKSGFVGLVKLAVEFGQAGFFTEAECRARARKDCIEETGIQDPTPEDVKTWAGKKLDAIYRKQDEDIFADNPKAAAVKAPVAPVLPVALDAHGAPTTGPEAIHYALANLDLDAKQREAMDVVKRKLKSKRPEAVKVLGYIDGLKRMGYKPDELMLTRVPVIPPAFRPYSVAGDTFVPGDVNELYRDLINLVGVHKELEGKLGPGSAFNKLNVYDAVSALYGFSDPTSPKTRERGVSGFLKKVTGTNPKFSFVQRKLLSKDQDYVARGVIGVDPELGLDQIGVPDSVLWTLYSPYVQRALVRSGMSAEQALRSIRDKTEAASRMLDREAAQRPVVYSRAPSWHKFNIIAGYPKRIQGDMIRINPLVTTGLNADFDGDTINVHLPALPESVQESKEKLLPSKMLFSIKDRQKVMATPKQEFIMGLYNAQRRPARKVVDFPDEASALAAIKNGQVAMSDEVTIKGKL